MISKYPEIEVLKIEDIQSRRLKELISSGIVKEVRKIPKYAPIYVKGEAFWNGYWQKYYIVKDVSYEPHFTNGGIYWRLKKVTVKWEDGKVSTHCTTLNPYRDYRLIMLKGF